MVVFKDTCIDTDIEIRAVEEGRRNATAFDRLVKVACKEVSRAPGPSHHVFWEMRQASHRLRQLNMNMTIKKARPREKNLH